MNDTARDVVKSGPLTSPIIIDYSKLFIRYKNLSNLLKEPYISNRILNKHGLIKFYKRHNIGCIGFI